MRIRLSNTATHTGSRTTIRKHFELSGYTGQHHDDEAVVAWFLAKNPADFTYDPASRLYAPPSPANQNSEIINHNHQCPSSLTCRPARDPNFIPPCSSTFCATISAIIASSICWRRALIFGFQFLPSRLWDHDGAGPG